MIALKDVAVSLGGRTVLEGITLTLAPGERTGILGPIGCGKSTLLRAIIGLQPIASGAITLFGEPCDAPESFRRHYPKIGFLFQNSDDQLIAPTVLEDVALGPLNHRHTPETARQKALDALTQVGLANLADRTVYTLSGGQKRLVALAGLLACDPQLLLLDEPDSALDPAGRARLSTALKAFKGTILTVSHNWDFLESLSSRIVGLQEGRLIETGPAQPHSHLHQHPLGHLPHEH